MKPIYWNTIVIEGTNSNKKRIIYFCIFQLFAFAFIVMLFHLIKVKYFDNEKALSPYYTDKDAHYRYTKDEACKTLPYEMYYLQKDLEKLRMEVEALPQLMYDILDLYSSDRIGLFDYAAEYAGGSVISTPNTVPYPSNNKINIFGLFSMTLASQPQTVLRATNLPGDCFAFYGTRGRIVISLGTSLYITNFTLEHIRIGEEASSAPKQFEVMGIDDARLEYSLGNFTYDITGRIVQTFSAPTKKKSFKTVELRIFSNYGNPVYTCIYRFRVHSLQ